MPTEKWLRRKQRILEGTTVPPKDPDLREILSQGIALALSRRLAASAFEEACGKRIFK